MTHTQIACHLSLNIVVSESGNARLLTLHLLPLTGLFFLLWSIWESWSRFWIELATIATDIQEAIIFTGKVLTIGFNSMAYGLGVTV